MELVNKVERLSKEMEDMYANNLITQQIIEDLKRKEEEQAIMLEE